MKSLINATALAEEMNAVEVKASVPPPLSWEVLPRNLTSAGFKIRNVLLPWEPTPLNCI